MKRYRIKKGITIENGNCYFPCPVYRVQMRILGFFWITIKEFIEEYPESDSYPPYAKNDSQELLDMLEMP